MKNVPFFLSSLLLLTTILFAENVIDATTSASGKLSFSGEVYTDHAIITWKDGYGNGPVQEILWGTTEAYGNTLNLLPYTKNTQAKDTLADLEPNTTYHAEFHRTYPQKGKDISTKFEFTTDGSTVIVHQYTNQATSNPNLSDGTGITLFSASGKKIAHQGTNQLLSAASVFSTTVVPGIYIARIVNKNNVSIHTYRCIIAQ